MLRFHVSYVHYLARCVWYFRPAITYQSLGLQFDFHLWSGNTWPNSQQRHLLHLLICSFAVWKDICTTRFRYNRRMLLPQLLIRSVNDELCPQSLIIYAKKFLKLINFVHTWHMPFRPPTYIGRCILLHFPHLNLHTDCHKALCRNILLSFSTCTQNSSKKLAFVISGAGFSLNFL